MVVKRTHLTELKTGEYHFFLCPAQQLSSRFKTFDIAGQSTNEPVIFPSNTKAMLAVKHKETPTQLDTYPSSRGTKHQKGNEPASIVISAPPFQCFALIAHLIGRTRNVAYEPRGSRVLYH